MPEVRARAKKAADAAELVVGDVLTIAGGSAAPVIQGVNAIQTVNGVSLSIVGFLLTSPRPLPANCFLTMQFTLLRYHN
jgi:hypothetical protein